MGLTAARAASREIASRVMVELVKQLEGDPLDLALLAIERSLAESPFHRLATCPDVDTMREFIQRRSKRLECRHGRYQTLAEQARERRTILTEIEAVLAGRYDRHLRNK